MEANNEFGETLGKRLKDIPCSDESTKSRRSLGTEAQLEGVSRSGMCQRYSASFC